MRSRFAKGNKAYSYSERSGARFPYKEMVFEPGTGFWVHKSESDGEFNIVDHPQNKAPRNIGEIESLENVYGDGYDGVASEQVSVADSTWLNKIRPEDPNVTGFDSGFDTGFGT